MWPQITTESIGLTRLIAFAAAVIPIRSLVVSPGFVQVVHWLVSLGWGRWNAGCL
ncbi:MAG: hypothetical protein GY832_47165 [Chloroflexi bacterium]|nr:hypothetical protein [Chloroflexota bacterium]